MAEKIYSMQAPSLNLDPMTQTLWADYFIHYDIIYSIQYSNNDLSATYACTLGRQPHVALNRIILC